jgi:5-methylcytosine-specific restriction endonuclease McrA
MGAMTEEVHHVRPISDRPDLRLEWTNLKSACKPCHAAADAKRRAAQ